MTPYRLARHLNAVRDLDPDAVSELLTKIVPCTHDLAESGLAICTIDPIYGHMVGVMGILNGCLGVKDVGPGAMCMVLDNSKRIQRFGVIEGV